MEFISVRAQDAGVFPQQGVLFSLGVDVYVRGNLTWMGLCMHACIPVFPSEREYKYALGYLFSFGIFLFFCC